MLYPNWENSKGVPVAVLHDGIVRAVVEDDNAAFRLLSEGTHSVSYQVTHNGWSVRPATRAEVDEHLARSN